MQLDAIRRMWERLRASGGDPHVLDTNSFTESERAVGRLVLPLLEDLRSANALASELTARTRALDVVLQLLPVAALVLDADGRLLRANGAAETLFGGRGIPVEVLRKAMHALRVGTEESDVRHPHPDPRQPPLRVVPAEVSEGAPAGDDPRVIFLVTSSHTPPVNASDVMARLGLTRMQAEVVARVAAGLSNQDVADALDLSTETVKTHLRAAFQRTGVPNRAALVALAFGARFGQKPLG